MAIDVESLYRSYGPMVLRRCRKLLRDETKAVDAMHDVFVEILKRNETLHDGAPAGLLLQTTTHVCLNKKRAERRRPETFAGDDEGGLFDRIAAMKAGGTEDRSLARRALDRIFGREPESTRLIAVLYYVDRLTLDEVADEVGLSVSGVRKRLRTLKARIEMADTRLEAAS